jgi:uncharacterized DUF497 family protein
MPMSFDPKKRRSNQRKHDVDFPDCYEAFDHPMVTRDDASKVRGEQRLVSLGWATGRVVMLVWVDEDEEPRLISCREAEPHEQEAYFREYPSS